MAGFNIANFNLYNFAKRFWDMFGNPTPMDVEVPQQNPNGDIQTYLCPNMAKFKKRVWDDVGGALGQFNRTFYVDAVNGDDNNDGSSGSPFKTILKAIYSTPVGGACGIHLEKNQDYNLGDSVNTITNRLVAFYHNGDDNGNENPRIHLTNRYNSSSDCIYYNYWVIENVRFIFFSNIEFVTDDLSNTNAGNIDGWRCFFRPTKANNYIGAKNPKITLKDSVRFVKVDDYIGASIDVSFNTPDITTNSSTFLIELMYGAVGTVKIYNISNIDNTNYLVAGVLKDSNGAYKNIVTNLDL